MGMTNTVSKTAYIVTTQYIVYYYNNGWLRGEFAWSENLKKFSRNLDATW